VGKTDHNVGGLACFRFVLTLFMHPFFFAFFVYDWFFFGLDRGAFLVPISYLIILFQPRIFGNQLVVAT